MKIDRSARSGWKVAPSRALGLGITGQASEGSGKARKACFHRNFDSSLRQRVPSYRQNATRGGPRSCRVGRSRRGRRNWTKSSFPESPRRALQVALSRRIQVDGALALFELARADAVGSEIAASSRRPTQLPPGAVAKNKTPGIHGTASGGCGGVSEDTRRAAAASPRPTQLARGARGRRKTPGAPRRRQERAGDEHDVWFVAAVAGARHPAGEGRRPPTSSSVPFPRRAGRSLPSAPLVLCLRRTGPLALRARSASELRAGPG
ncbi:hypothetical protein THAOC_08332, partial [Thalassiosira oceanica]